MSAPLRVLEGGRRQEDPLGCARGIAVAVALMLALALAGGAVFLLLA